MLGKSEKFDTPTASPTAPAKEATSKDEKWWDPPAAQMFGSSSGPTNSGRLPMRNKEVGGEGSLWKESFWQSSKSCSVNILCSPLFFLTQSCHFHLCYYCFFFLEMCPCSAAHISWCMFELDFPLSIESDFCIALLWGLRSFLEEFSRTISLWIWCFCSWVIHLYACPPYDWVALGSE